MTRRPRIFSSHLSRRERRVYRAATVFFVLLFAALVWPVYPLFSGIRPMILGVPLSLAYVVLLVLASFAALLALFLWEGRRGVHRRPPPPPPPSRPPAPVAGPDATGGPPGQPGHEQPGQGRGEHGGPG